MAQNRTWFPQLKNAGENCWVGGASWLLCSGLGQDQILGLPEPRLPSRPLEAALTTHQDCAL